MFQQFVVDQYCKMETAWLYWVKKNQIRQLDAQLYHGMIGSLRQNKIANSGAATILPASVTGSPRYLHKKCLDTLVLVGKLESHICLLQ